MMTASFAITVLLVAYAGRSMYQPEGTLARSSIVATKACVIDTASPAMASAATCAPNAVGFSQSRHYGDTTFS